MASHSEFGHFYQLQNPSMLEDHFIDAMAGTSTALTPSQTSPSSPGDSSPFSGTLNPEGRVSKPARKRSRASRRTPTTLVNTDPSNFRAMVQQLTGGPAAAYTVVAEPRYQMFGEGNISFGFGTNPQRSNNPSTEDVQQQQQQRQAYQQQQLQFNRNIFNAINRNHDGSLS